MVAAKLSDCEERGGVLEQDVNAWTSLGYVAAGLILTAALVRGKLPRSFAALAAAVTAEGIGSFLFHGSASDAAQFLHDVSLAGALGFVAGWHAGRIAGAPERGALTGTGVAAVVGAVLWAVEPPAINVLVGALVAVIAGSVAVARHRRLPPVWNAPMLGLLITAAVAWFAGSAGSPICAERSPAQAHGLWHVLTAVLVLAWANQAASVATPERRRTGGSWPRAGG